MDNTYQPEVRSLKQIKRDYHRSLHPSPRQRLKAAGDRILRGALYLVLLAVGAVALYALGLHAALSILIVLVVLSFFTAR